MDENLNLKGNLEIQKALNQFESEQGSVQTSQPNEVVDVMRSQPTHVSQKYDTPKMIKWAMKYSGGMIKDERQAEHALLVLVIIMFGLSLYFFFGDSIMKTINPPRGFVNSPGMILPGTRPIP